MTNVSAILCLRAWGQRMDFTGLAYIMGHGLEPLFPLHISCVWCHEVPAQAPDTGGQRRVVRSPRRWMTHNPGDGRQPGPFHMLVDCDPQFGIHRFVRRYGWVARRRLRQEFSPLRTRVPTLWTNAISWRPLGVPPLAVIKSTSRARNAAGGKFRLRGTADGELRRSPADVWLLQRDGWAVKRGRKWLLARPAKLTAGTRNSICTRTRSS